MKSDENRSTVTELGGALQTREKLPYKIELWNLGRQDVERVLGRAGSMTLARAIFLAARSEYLGRHVVLRRGGRIVDESP
jgi:hypothetical protein